MYLCLKCFMKSVTEGIKGVSVFTKADIIVTTGRIKMLRLLRRVVGRTSIGIEYYYYIARTEIEI